MKTMWFFMQLSAISSLSVFYEPFPDFLFNSTIIENVNNSN